VDLACLLAANDSFLQEDNAGLSPELTFLAAAAPFFAAQAVIGQVSCHLQKPSTKVAFIPWRLTVQLEEDLLDQILSGRPLPQQIIKPPVYQGIVALKQGLEFSGFDGPSLPCNPCYDYNTTGVNFVTLPEIHKEIRGIPY
jgi:hypothetical protein